MDRMDNGFPRVLIISHNVFSKNTSMGKTLATYFNGWDKKRIAQLFFHSEVPTSNVCENYYKYTDVDAIKSIVCRRHRGTILTATNVEPDRIDAVDTKKLTGIYNYGRQRLPYIYILRDMIWKLSGWKSSDLYTWVRDFSPEIIFFASGDYEFSYLVALTIANEMSIPMVSCCFDDYYLYNKNANRLLGDFRQKHFMKIVRKTLNRSSYIFTVNDLMSEAYSKLFNKRCPVLYTAATINSNSHNSVKKGGISYLGGLGLNRDEQLIEIGRTLISIDDERIPKLIDVYSGETDKVILSKMIPENGIAFHGSVSSEKVAEIIASSVAVIHTESFDPANRERVRYSLSTKIPDSIASGTCLLAYGPSDVASIDYLLKNDAAFVATNREELKQVIIQLYSSDEARKRITENAIELGKRNHNSESITKQVSGVLRKAIQEWNDEYI